MEEPTASELEALNVKLWKFRPPIPSGAKEVNIILHCARRGEAPRSIAQIRNAAAPSVPLVVALQTAEGISSTNSPRISVAMGLGGINLRTAMDNDFAGKAIGMSTPLRVDPSGKVVLMVASEGQHAVSTGSLDNDIVLYLTIEPQ
jgi:hypothetical protein